MKCSRCYTGCCVLDLFLNPMKVTFNLHLVSHRALLCLRISVEDIVWSIEAKRRQTTMLTLLGVSRKQHAFLFCSSSSTCLFKKLWVRHVNVKHTCYKVIRSRQSTTTLPFSLTLKQLLLPLHMGFLCSHWKWKPKSMGRSLTGWPDVWLRLP